MIKQRFLIAGYGFVGRRLAGLLTEASADVFALRRGPGNGLPGATAVRADLTDPRQLTDLPQALDAVVF